MELGKVLAMKVLSGAAGRDPTPTCQRRMRQLPLETQVPMGGEWIAYRAEHRVRQDTLDAQWLPHVVARSPKAPQPKV